MNRNFTIHLPNGALHGHLEMPATPRGVIVLARARHVALDEVIAANLAARGYAMFSMELLTLQEAHFADSTQNVSRLAQRLVEILDLLRNEPELQTLPVGIFANGDTSPAAIRAAAQRDAQVKALVCHGGVVDRAGLQALQLLVAPLLMLYDAEDLPGKSAYQRAQSHLVAPHETHTLGQGEDPVSRVAAWFGVYL